MKPTRRSTHTRKRRSIRAETDALRIVDRIAGRDPKLRRAIADATLNAELAELLYEARARAGLTQSQLARRIGTKQPVIARLEDADYNGHSLTMVQRIAAALAVRVEIRLVPSKRKPR